ncbi:MAG TPA: spore germination protein GerW family protein [Blastocatellia bacterium]|nr:spore germination protein GerW family protein [Blastocatellia bacterium]
MFDKQIRVQKEASNSLPERLAETLKTSAGAKMIYGDPVEHDGVTIIPVAKLRYGFGGGGGKHNEEEGGGGGGAEIVQPAGYIELKDGSSKFHAIRDPMAFVPLVIAGGLTGLLLVRGLYQMLRQGRVAES